jgi:dynein heavy chain 2
MEGVKAGGANANNGGYPQAININLLNKKLELNKNVGIFVTMNPAGKNYGGRSKLPDNLKQLFRPVAMSKPDIELIAEVLLYAEGFKNASEIAKKVVSLFKFSKQLCSKQQHYDWGLRALKTILVVSGELIQNLREKGETVSKEKEAELLIQAVRVNTLSKLTFADSKKFQNLLEAIFVGIKVSDVEYKELEEKIKETLEEQGLQFDKRQVDKIKQFYEATRQRMGVVLIGPSGCGKTTIWQVLKTSLKKLGENVVTHIMNPKSISREMLLGYMNNDTREFNDGILTSVSRVVSKADKDTKSWVICDGDIDPSWIESLNSVLDDNHLLTLPNGERISFEDNINFIFETHDLQYASPATISRMGMIYLNNEDINLSSVTRSWLETLKSQQKRFLHKNFLENTVVDQLVKLLIKFQGHMPVESTMIGMMKILLS